LCWALDLVGGAKQREIIQKIAPNSILYHYNGTNYTLGLAPGAGSCEQLSNGVVRLSPNGLGKLGLILNGHHK
jgi:hypothetical protein